MTHDAETSGPRRTPDLLRAIADTARIVAEDAASEDFVVKFLRAIGEALGWELGALWTVDAASDRLQPAGIWHGAVPAISAFAAATRSASFARGVGLPGRVWATGTPAWITDVTVDTNFPRRAAAAEAGLHGAFGFPVVARGQCVGVIEFLTSVAAAPDDDLLRAMAGLGTQLGQFIERRRLEADAARQQASNAAALAAALDCIVTMDHEGRIVEFNPAAESTFGHARAAVVGRLMAEVIIPERLRERHRQGLAHYLATGEGPVIGRRIEVPALHADGHEFPVELTIIRLPSAGPPLFTGFLRDITERKSAERERAELLAREQEARREAEEAERRAAFLAEAGALISRSLDYETTFSNIVRLAVPDLADWSAIHLVADDGTIRCVALAHRDPAITAEAWPYVRDYRFDPDAAEGGPKVIRTGQSVLYREVPPGALEQMARDPEDLRVRHLLGLESVIAVPLMSGGRVLGALAFVMSQSGRRYDGKDLALAEDLARRAALAVDNALLYRDARKANQMKDEFLATLSHELRTPLTSILGWARMLASGQVDPSQRQRALTIIERNATSQSALINDLLDMSRIVTGRLVLDRRPLSVPAVIQAVVDTSRPSADAKGIEIAVTVERPARDVALLADPDRLQQVLWNLLSNAVKFTPRDGRITIAAAVEGDDLRLDVTDTGEGIEAGMLPYVFDRFRQADSSSRRPHAGLGLGLAIVRQLVELHGGTVEARSPGRGGGTTFSVRLPLTARARDPRAAATEDVPARGGELRGVSVLVVEDDDDTRELFRTILEGAGATVRGAASAEDALGLIAASRPDVVVADIGLPGIDGHELLRRIRSRSESEIAGVPAIAVSAYDSERHRTAAREAGFEDYVIKPPDPADLVRLVAGMVSRRRTGG